MQKSISRTGRRTLISTIAMASTLALAGVLLGGAGSATAATLSNTTWTASNTELGSAATTYTFAMTTATAGIVGSVTASVPPATTGTVGVGTVYGLGAGSATLVGTTLTYTVTSPALVASGTPLYIEFTGLTNTTTAGTYSSTVTTLNNLTVPVVIDSATSPSLTFSSASTAMAVQVPKSLTFTNDTPSFALQLDPSIAALSTVSKAVKLTVKTNAGQGYTISAKDTGLQAPLPGGGNYTIAAASSGIASGILAASFAPNTFGVSAALTAGGTSVATVLGAGLSLGSFVGYTTTGQTFLSASKPTGNTADTLVLTNQVKIDYNAAAGAYTDAITYTITPTY